MIGIVFNNSILFSRSPKLKRQKALFLPERQLVKDSAVLIKQNGEKIKGTLVLTYDHLIFLGNGKKEIKIEKKFVKFIQIVARLNSLECQKVSKLKMAISC